MKILIINGSHRKGNTDIVVEDVKKELSSRIGNVRILTLRDIEMKLPDGCEACAESEPCPNIHDQFSEAVEPTIRNYDVYVLATPTYDDGVTPLTKIFWDRIVSWCAESRMYLKDKKLAVVVHGMAGEKSWSTVVRWVKGVCLWEKCIFAGSLMLKSGSRVGSIEIDKGKVKDFIEDLVRN